MLPYNDVKLFTNYAIQPFMYEEKCLIKVIVQEKGWGTKRICSDFSSRECTPAGRVLPVNKSIDEWRDRLGQYFK